MTTPCPSVERNPVSPRSLLKDFDEGLYESNYESDIERKNLKKWCDALGDELRIQKIKTRKYLTQVNKPSMSMSTMAWYLFVAITACLK